MSNFLEVWFNFWLLGHFIELCIVVAGIVLMLGLYIWGWADTYFWYRRNKKNYKK